jgi:hypothetical protein
MKVNYLLTLCLFKMFYMLAIPKYICVFVIKLSKEKTYAMPGCTWEIEVKRYCLLLTWAYVLDSAPYFHNGVSSVNFVLYAQMSIQCVEYAITEIYLLLVARNLLKYILLLFIYLVLRHIALLVASLVVASLSLVKDFWLNINLPDKLVCTDPSSFACAGFFFWNLH